jgi:cation transport regulator ChaC
MGRVLTLVKDEEACVYGIAYRIKSDDMEKTFEDLNFREKCGYSLKQVDFSPISLDDCNKFEPIKTVCYYANEKNVYYSPLNDPQKISKQIYETSGPSGNLVFFWFS